MMFFFPLIDHKSFEMAFVLSLVGFFRLPLKGIFDPYTANVFPIKSVGNPRVTRGTP